MKKYNVIIWYNDETDVNSIIVNAESKEEACIKAMRNYCKDYYPEAIEIG